MAGRTKKAKGASAAPSAPLADYTTRWQQDFKLLAKWLEADPEAAAKGLAEIGIEDTVALDQTINQVFSIVEKLIAVGKEAP